MEHRFAALAIASVAAVVTTNPVSAADVRNAIVYIECAKDGAISKGTGVIVSGQGHVLTAKHVVPADSSCRGSIGTADVPTQRLVPRSVQADVDAVLLQFPASGQYDAVGYCMLEDWMVRKKIFVAGFPGTTKSFTPSYREGILSTTFPDQKGLLETDGQTVAGMSGGPVLSKNLNGLIGIVIGAQFDSSGVVSSYAILAASELPQDFRLEPSEQPCYRRSRIVDLPDRLAEWTAQSGMNSANLDVSEDEGVCFLAGISGNFNDNDDSVHVELHDGKYRIVSRNFSGGTLKASVRCIWYD